MQGSSDAALDLIRFIDASPTPFHAVLEARRRLDASGYVRLHEHEPWTVGPGARVYVVRNETSLVAFEVGANDPLEHGMRLVCAHTDSPNLRVKPNADLTSAGLAQLAVEPYGGVLFHTWLDRDLGLAGRLLVRTPQGIESRLVDLRQPLLRIASLAIHLNRGVNTEGLIVNAQKHLPPVFALVTSELRDLRAVLAASLTLEGISREAIVAWDLMLTDIQPSTLLGASDEFVSAPRLDNLASCHAALQALGSVHAASPATRCVALFDHEEVGSRSAQGAAGSFLRDCITRVLGSSGLSAPDSVPRVLARSFLVSADMAHALHPNHGDKHDPAHAPLLGGGPVLKSNSNQSYATDAESWARFESFAADTETATQRFVARSDLGCGSTVGPILAASLGMRAVDVGLPMLSMHSCRELAAASDVAAMIRVLGRFFAS